MTVQPKFDTFIIDTPALFQSLKDYESKVDSDLVVLDVETDGVIEKTSKLYGVGLAFTELKGFYVPWRSPEGTKIWSPSQESEIVKWILSICSKRKLIGHNLVFDTLILKNNLNIDLIPYIYADTILMKHTLAEEPPFGLKEVSVLEIGAWCDLSQEELKTNVLLKGGRWTKDEKDMYLADTSILGRYCAWDCILTLMLYNIYLPKLKAEGLEDLFFKDEVMELYRSVTIPMKDKGFPIDIPYFTKLKQDITKEIEVLDKEIYELIKRDVAPFEAELLEEEFPVRRSGNFPKAVAQILGAPLPLNSKTRAITIAAKAMEEQKKLSPQHTIFYDWVLGINNIDITSPTFKVLYTSGGDLIKDAQRLMWSEKYGTERVFNLNSNDHLINLIFDVMGFSPIERTPGGKPKIDDDFLDTLKGITVIDKLKDYKKLNKLLSTYVEGILDRQIDGVIYTSMLQFGTTSGRYASRNPNLNNLPANTKEKTLVDKYTNAIRKGLIAPPGYKVIGCDFSSLEPHIAAYVSGDPDLIDIFVKGQDFYSAIGIKQFNIKDAHPYKDDTPDSFPVKYKELRDKIKTYALAAFYGATASRIAELLGISYKEAQDLLDGYFKAFPKIKSYIYNCHYLAKTTGMVKNKVGRIRHLKEARSIYTLYGDNVLDIKYAKANGLTDIRRKYKNLLNNSVNSGIQSLAASCLARGMIKLEKKIKRLGLDASIRLLIHDEALIICREDQTTVCAKSIKECMETCLDLSPIKLKANPIIGNSYGECK